MSVTQDKSSLSPEKQLVVFRISDEEFGVEISQVREIVRLVPITPIPRAPEFIKGVVNLRGSILPVIDLAQRLNLKAIGHSDKTRVVVVELEDSAVGMIVDEVTEVLRLAEKNIEQTPELISTEIKHEYLVGVGKLEQRLLILIDLRQVLSPEEVEDMKKINAVPKEK